MRILLDENVPVDLLPLLRKQGHEASSVNQLGWKGLKNGDLLLRAASEFDLFVTRDKDFDTDQLGRHVDTHFGIVLLAVPQQKGSMYAAAFAQLWPEFPETLIGKVSRLGPPSM